MNLNKLILEGKVHDDIEDAIRFLDKHGIKLDGDSLDYYIGSGAFGDVYKVKGKNKVIKFYPTVGYEIEKYDKLKDKKLQNVVNIYFNRALKSVGVGIVVMEYLEEAPKIRDYYLVKGIFIRTFEDIILDNQTEGLGYGEWLRKYRYRYESAFHTPPETEQIEKIYRNDKELLAIIFCSLSEYIIGYYTRKDNDVILETLVNEEQLFRDVMNGIRELHAMDIQHEDIHAGNILYDPKAKKYKLIDPI